MALPLFKPEMIEPRDAKITTSIAKKVFRLYVTQTKALYREEIAEHVGYLADEIKEHEEMLKDEVRSARDSFGQEVAELKREVSGIKLKLEKAADPEVKEELEADLAAAEEELQMMSKYIIKAEADLQSFKEDKRLFIVDYINRQFQR